MVTSSINFNKICADVIYRAHKCHIDNNQAVNLAYLALGYAHNLGITQDASLFSGQSNNTRPLDTEGMAQRENTTLTEGKRTLLGLYCVLSM